MKKLISISAAALIAATSATAAVRHLEAAYARAGVNFSIAQGSLVDFNTIANSNLNTFKKKNAASFEVAGGYKFDENLRAELAGRFRTSAKSGIAFDSNTTPNTTADAGTYFTVLGKDADANAIGIQEGDASLTRKSWSVGINGIYDINMDNQHFCPFVLVGVGFGREAVTLTSANDIRVGANPIVGTKSITFKKSGVVGQVGFGVRFHVASNLDLQAAYSFVFRGSSSLNGGSVKSTATGATDTQVGSQKFRLNTHEIGLGAILWL